MGVNSSSPALDLTQSPSQYPRNSYMSMSAESNDHVYGGGAVLRGGGTSTPASDKKKKSSKLSTLKKKLSRVSRHNRCADYGKALRELTSTWSVRELHSLADEYEASAALKELTILANLARPHASTVVEDLAALYEHKYCTDVDLIYQGTVIPAHRAILCIRCVFFRELLARYPDYGAQVPVVLRTPEVSVSIFTALLRFLYTGDFGLDESRQHCLKKLLAQIVAEFGAPNSLEQDLRTLLDTGAYSDAVLVFSDSSESSSVEYTAGGYASPRVGGGGGQCLHSQCPHATTAGGTLRGTASVVKPDGTLSMIRRYRNELRCHKAILAARSSFFRNLELRRGRSGEELTERHLHTPSYIVLDESIIPKRYARVLLGAVYLDCVDLSSILRSSASVPTLTDTPSGGGGSGGGAQSSGHALTHVTHVDEAMELYHIGRFLEISALAHGCEDIIAESLNMDNLPAVLQWSSEAHGSSWVQQQAMHFLREEFIQVANSPLLGELSKEQLIDAIQSDFLQAREIDVLAAVIKWAEFRLVKHLEEREPNLLTHTAHSISRKGIKKKDLNDSEVREILADLLPYVRTSHIIPAHSDVLTGAIKRGLVSVPPSHLLGGGSASESSSASAWVRTRNLSLFVKPRLFIPYYDELKVSLFVKPRLFIPYYDELKILMKEQNAKAQEPSSNVVQLHVVHMCTKPDALYMLEDKMYAASPPSMQQIHWSGCPSTTVDIIAGTIPVPEREVLLAMHQRDTELMRSKSAQRAYALICSNKPAVTHQIHLRVVREFGLPTSAIQVLQDSAHHHQDVVAVNTGMLQRGGACYLSPVRGGRSSSAHHSSAQGGGGIHCQGRRITDGHHSWTLHRGGPELLSMNSAPAGVYDQRDVIAEGHCGMPDIAIATASASRLSVQDNLDLDISHPDLERLDVGHAADLDLGDGASHCGGSGGGGGGSSSLYI